MKHNLNLYILRSCYPQGKIIPLIAIKTVLWVWERERELWYCTSFIFWFGEIIVSFLCYRSTCDSWTMRCRTQMNARGILWPCMTAAVLWRTWEPSSAALWPMTSCCAQAWGWSACGRTRAVGTADFKCSSHPFKNVSFWAGCPSHACSDASLIAVSGVFSVQSELSRLWLGKL